MLTPPLVREIVHSMCRRATSTEITVKCRLGVTGRESWDNLLEFVRAVREGGNHFNKGNATSKIIYFQRLCFIIRLVDF
jgi:hypothetical protein